ncbi:calcium calmodulin dependent kinase [Lecanosticta acicola]|uniref:Calcium calmodulin dependent kinase n=1 Tax=Lecanosticta acicola TaxID=111012 RepID=A0AAI9EF26_9PEZI|nr:calcium calmodulin dependent kinase [Lecanosticta acicola]
MAAASLNELSGMTGRRYRFKQLLQERPHIGRVWTASNFNERVLPQLSKDSGTFLRLPLDTIPDERIFVYKYLSDDFLQLVRKDISLQNRRSILRAALHALKELHEKDVVHLDIKPDNIMVQCRHNDPETIVEQVQLTDLENAAYLPPGRCIKGMLAGNDNWRSPEAHFKGELNKFSDVFSFGLVCIYAVLGRVVCGPDDDFAKHEAQGALPAMIRLQRQVSYFGDRDGLNGLIKHVGDNEVNCQVLSMLWDERNEDYIPYKPFVEWPEVQDEAFRNLIKGLTNLDPTRRLSTYQALQHPWFSEQN